MIKNVILDLNGVVIKSRNLTERMQEKYGIPIDDSKEVLSEIMQVVRQPDAPSIYSLWRPYFERWGKVITEKEFLEFWFSGEEVVQEALDYMKELRNKGIKVFILSNNFKERTQYYRTNFPKLFDNLNGSYFSWETGHIKPGENSGAWRDILDKENLDPSETIYFDDQEKNVEAARACGIEAYKFETLDEIKRLIDESTSEVQVR